MPDGLGITIETAPGAPVRVTLAGRFDVAEAPRVREAVLQGPAAAAPHLVIDLNAVTFLDSAGLAVLARARRDRALTGASLVLVRPVAEDALRIFRLTRFEDLFTMVDREEAP
ncbi:STAS domain-containing protein [Rathayibacter tanaceti]|uniref:Anti-sigma factor antagonist n=2 Tax=Rathayibacter tanaceti TaxID=1671680 RepID=A0A162J0C9_9MICO|nr:STAS domain-containing protein [Rathayibacter tanaceti]KZX20367.1 Anti-sigma-B factor antagonist [Rathayibacter tanaceti]QHC56605.1 anti-sigma factor antagonist [Rathayibacter tanaceti]TCO36255.1 anti-anti-sigma factor [Rathayibacter tanaceti]